MPTNSPAEPLGPMELISELETSSMLFAPTLEEHQQRYATLFTPEDRVLDVGAGDFSFVRFLRSRGITAEGNHREVPTPAGFQYTALNLSESIGYLSRAEFGGYLRDAVRKVIIKDFYVRPGGNTRVANSNFDFGALRDMAYPLLLSRGFRVEMAEFPPYRDRWLALLEKHQIPYVFHVDIRPVIVRAVR